LPLDTNFNHVLESNIDNKFSNHSSFQEYKRTGIEAGLEILYISGTALRAKKNQGAKKTRSKTRGKGKRKEKGEEGKERVKQGEREKEKRRGKKEKRG